MALMDWLRCTDSGVLLDAVAERLSERKLRLFAVACCRRIWHLMPDDACRNAVETAESFADGLATARELANCIMNDAQFRTAGDYARSAANYAIYEDAITAARACPVQAAQAVLFAARPWSLVARDAEKAVQSSLFRDLVGDPYSKAKVLRAWRTTAVTEISEAIYDRRDFAMLPILADALTDAGCDDETILSHCELSNHIRGCWLVDTILKKD